GHADAARGIPERGPPRDAPAARRGRRDAAARPVRPDGPGAGRAPPRWPGGSRRSRPRRVRGPAGANPNPTRAVNRFEYWLSAAGLRILAWLFGRLPHHRDRVVLASPRKPALDGNLLAIEEAIRTSR